MWIVAVVACGGAVTSSSLVDRDATALVDAIRAGRTTSRALTEASLQRIAELDREGPALHAVLSLGDRALDEAAARDADPAKDGLLHGLPVLIKDNIDVAGQPTTAGSLALRDHRPTADAFLVARLREAGAVLLGKTNLSEWANFRGRRSISGWSALGGQTRNPYVLDRSPCGSSSGSAVAVAAGLVPLAVGTETDGSILCPAAVNGVVGVKPTMGLVSRHGIVPIAPSQDTAGPLARTVADAALLLEVLAAADPTNPASAARPADLDTGYRAALNDDALQGARIGVLPPEHGHDARVIEVFQASLGALTQRGAVLVEVAPMSPDAILSAEAGELELLYYEFGPAMAVYLEGVEGLSTLGDLVAFHRRHAAVELRWFGQEHMEHAATVPRDPSRYDVLRREARDAFGRDFLAARMDAEGLDAIVTPTGGPAWPIDPVLGDRSTGSSTHYTAVSGYPAVTVPMGYVEGLPLGLSFLGRPFSEARLLGIAHAYEQATRHRRAPTFRPTIR